MLKRIRKVHGSDRGFTLTELLITIVILGVLAGIVVFAVSAFTNDGKTVACQTDKKNVEIAAEAYRAKTGAYPSQATDALRIKELVDTFYLKAAPNGTYGITLSTGGAVAATAC